MADADDWKNLPTLAKAQHQQWKARLDGYKEMKKLFATQNSEKSPIFVEYASHMKKFAVETNPAAQEAALDAIVTFLEYAAVNSGCASDIMTGLIAKGLTSTRQKSKELVMECITSLIEIERHEIVGEELLKGLSNKNPKLVSACLQTFQDCLREFGPEVLSVKPLFKEFPRLFDDRDKTVREETKKLVVEVRRWIGRPMPNLLSNVKPVVMNELTALFDQLPDERPRVTRYLRSKRPAEVDPSSVDGVDTQVTDAPATDATNLDDLITPVDVLKAIPSDYWTQIAEKKWQDRHAALESLETVTNTPKIIPGDFGDLVKSLLQIVSKDSNIPVTTVAIRVLGQLAAGLRQKFSPYAHQTVTTCIAKFKERKVTVVAALRDTVDAAMKSIALDTVVEDVCAALKHKSPGVRSEVAQFLSRIFARCTQASLNRKLLKSFTTALCATSMDTVLEVREGSFAALGTAMRVVTPKHIEPFLADLDELRRNKIKEYCDNTATSSVTATGTRPTTAPGPTTKAAVPGTEKRPNTAATDSPSNDTDDSRSTKKSSGPPKSNPRGAKRPATAGGKQASSSSTTSAASNKPAVPTEVLLSDDQVLQQGNEHFGDELMGSLCGSEWKLRLQAATDFKTKAETFPPGNSATQVLCRLLLRKPGLKDTNQQVLRARIETIDHLLTSAKSVSSNLAEVLQPDLMDKIGDAKVGEAVRTTLTTLAERTTFSLIGGLVLASLPQLKNPRSQSETLDWLNQGIREFGMKLSVKDLVAAIRTGLIATNPTVRQNNISLAGTVHLFLGDQIRNLFAEEKALVLNLLTAEFDKNIGQTAPKPTRGVTARQKQRASGGVDDEAGDDDDVTEGDDQTIASEELDTEALLPRVDISNQITSEMLTLLASKNWKERDQGLTAIAGVLSSAKLIEGSNGALSTPLAAVAKICNDANKNLSKTAMGLLADFAKALPKPDAVKYLKNVQPSILQRFGDSKPQVREAAFCALSAWQSRVATVAMLESEVISDALTTDNSFARAGLLKWLATALVSIPSNSARRLLPADFADAVLSYALSALEDRAPEAREQAQAVLPQLVRILGWDVASRAANRLKATSKEAALAQLEKAREKVLASEPPPAPTTSTNNPVVSKGSKVVRGGGGAQVVREEEEPPGEEPPPDTSGATGIRGGGKKKPGTTDKKGPASATAAPDDKSGSTLILVANKTARSARLADEKKRKLLKWDFDTPTKDHIQQLNNLFLAASTSPDLHAMLFHTDFKQHIKALDQLVQLLEVEGGEEATVVNLDLLLRWVVLRFFETNPVVLGRCLDYLIKVFSRMSESGLSLSEQDSNAFIPYLVTKAGDSKDAVRQNVRIIFKLLSGVITPGRLYVHVSNGTKSKTNKTRQECLDEIGSLIDRFGINVCQPSPAVALKALSQHIGDRDSGVRSAVLNALVSAYFILGEPIWKMIGSLPDKDRSMLEERIKRANRPPTTATVPPNDSAPVLPNSNRAAREPSEPRRRTMADPNTGPAERRQPISAARARAIDMLHELGDLSPEKAPDMPDLLSLDADVDELFKPIDIPPIKTHSRQPVMNALLRTSPDTASAITMVVTAISSSDLVVSCHALAELDMVLRDDKWYLLMSHVNQMLMLIVIQLRQINTRYFGDPTVSSEQLCTLIRCHLATVESLFRRSTLAREASRDSLRELIQALFHLMLDERLTELPDGESIIRAINSLAVSIIQAANATRILSCLIHLIHDSVSNGNFTNRFTQTALKSVWRITKGIDTTINNISLDVILLDCHHFLKAFPSPTWKTKKSDVPLRTVKTLLHMICRLQGSSVLDYVNQVPNKEDSELEAYVIRTLKATAGIQVTSSSQTKQPVDGTEPAGKKVFQPSAATRDRLTDIFKKIGSKQPEEGLNELYDFTQLYPELDIAPHLNQCSQFFQSFIRQALKNIAIERSRCNKTSAGGHGLRSSLPHALNGLDSTDSVARSYDLDDQRPVNPKLFMSRLAMLRRQLGIGGVSTTANCDNNPVGLLGIIHDGDGDADLDGSKNVLHNTLRNMVNPEGDDQNVDPASDKSGPDSARTALSAGELLDIRRRLDRIRSAQRT